MADSYVCSGARMQCTKGTAEAVLTVPPSRTVTLCGVPMANISDHVPNTNLAPFGLCRSLQFPPTASATAANHGVLTPMPCKHNTPSPWMPGKVDYLVKGQPALLRSSKCECGWGGTISIINDGQKEVKSPVVNHTRTAPPRAVNKDDIVEDSISQMERQKLNLDINIDVISSMMPVYEYETPVGKALIDALGNEINSYSLTEAGRFREILYGVDSIVRPFVENDNVESINLNLSIPEQEEIIDTLETVVLKGGVSITVHNESCPINNICTNDSKIKRKTIEKSTDSAIVQLDSPAPLSDNQSSFFSMDSLVETTDVLNTLQNEVSAFSSDNKKFYNFETYTNPQKGINGRKTKIEELNIGSNGKLYGKSYHGGGKTNIKILGKVGDYKEGIKKIGKFGKIGGGAIGLLDVPEVVQKIHDADDYKDYGTIVGEKTGEIIGGRAGTVAGTAVGTYIVGTVLTAAGVTVSAPVSLLIIGTCIIVGTVAGSAGGKFLGGQVGGKTGEIIDTSGAGNKIEKKMVDFMKNAGESLERLPDGFFSGPKW